MRNFVAPGKILSLPAPAATVSGQGALIGNTFGIACADIANGVVGEWLTEGVVTHAKATGASTNVAVGAIVYWDNAARLCTGVASGNTKIGVATAAAATADATITFKIITTI